MKQMIFNVVFILVITFLYVYVTVRIYSWGVEEGIKKARIEMQDNRAFVDKR